MTKNKKEEKKQEEEQNLNDNQEDKKEKSDKKKEEKSDSKKKKSDKIKDKEKIIEELTEQTQQLNEKLLRLNAEFDNYKKRTLKEKVEMSKSAGSEIFMNMLPVVDDLNLAMKSVEEAKDVAAVKEGMKLIYEKFNSFLKQSGVQPIEAIGKEFDTDEHEAVTKIPIEEEEQKGKVVDEVQKGYKLNDKILRYSKVVVGE